MNITRLSIEHESFPKSRWALEVQNGSTRLAYEEWVEHKIEAASDAAPEPAEEPAPPENVTQVVFTPNAQAAWLNTQRQRERGQLAGQRGSFGMSRPKTEYWD